MSVFLAQQVMVSWSQTSAASQTRNLHLLRTRVSSYLLKLAHVYWPS